MSSSGSSTDLSGGYAGGGLGEMWAEHSTAIIVGIVILIVLVLAWYYWTDIKVYFGYPEKMYGGNPRRGKTYY